MSNFEYVDILLVEDNPHDAELTIRALNKKNIGNKLYHVEDGAEALDFLYCRNKYSNRNSVNKLKIVLLDIKLPKVNGLEVLKTIKEDPNLRKTPVVMVTSSREDPDIERAYELGANSYVVKPVDFDTFFEAMSKIGMYWLLVNQTIT